MNKILQIQSMEKEIANYLHVLKEEIYAKIAFQPFDGTVLSTKPLVFIMKSSDIFLSNNLSPPEYFSPQKQAEAARTKLDRCKTGEEIIQAVEIILKEKRVRVNSDYVPLNDKTLEAICRSEIGKYITKENDNEDR